MEKKLTPKMMSSQVNSTPDSAPSWWKPSYNDPAQGSQDGTVSPSSGYQNGIELYDVEHESIRLDHLQTILNEFVFFIVYLWVLQIAFFFSSEFFTS